MNIRKVCAALGAALLSFSAAAQPWIFDSSAKTLTEADESGNALEGGWVLYAKADNATTRTLSIGDGTNHAAKNKQIGLGTLLDFRGSIKDANGNVWTLVAVNKNAFAGFPKATDYYFPDTTTSFGMTAFSANTAIKHLHWSDNVTTINTTKNFAMNCTALETIEPFLPAGVKSVGETVFSGCTSLRSTLYCTNPNMTSLPKSFVMNDPISRVVLGAGITTIGAQSFQGCTALRDIEFLGNPPTTWTQASSFTSIPANSMRFIAQGDNAKWEALVNNTTYVTAWENLAASARTAYYKKFGAFAPQPKGATTTSITKTAGAAFVVYRATHGEKELLVGGLDVDGAASVTFGSEDVSPAYSASYEEPYAVEGDSVVCSAPQFVTVGDKRYECYASVLEEEEEGGIGIWKNAVTNLGNSVTYTPTDGKFRKLTWLWREVGYRVTVVYPEELGSVAIAPAPDANGFYPKGTVVTLTATATAPATFDTWYCNTYEVSKNPVLQVTVDEVMEIRPYFAKAWEIQTIGGKTHLVDGYWQVPCAVSGTEITAGDSKQKVYPAALSEFYQPFVLDLRKPVLSGESITAIAGGGSSFTILKNQSILEIRLPDTLRTIGNYAFTGMSNLRKITPFLPENVTYIGANEFKDCSSLEGDFVFGLKAKVATSFHYNGGHFNTCPKLNSITVGKTCIGCGASDGMFYQSLQSTPLKELVIYSTNNTYFGSSSFSSGQMRVLKMARLMHGRGGFTYKNWSDYATKVYLSKTDPDCVAFMADPTKMTPWDELDDATQAKYRSAFPNDPETPKGLSLLNSSTSNNYSPGNWGKQWIFKWDPGPDNGTTITVK